MRVPTVLQGQGALSQLDRIRADLNRAAREIASGTRVHVPSDDPIAAARGSRIQNRLDTLGQYKKTLSPPIDIARESIGSASVCFHSTFLASGS